MSYVFAVWMQKLYKLRELYRYGIRLCNVKTVNLLMPFCLEFIFINRNERTGGIKYYKRILSLNYKTNNREV